MQKRCTQIQKVCQGDCLGRQWGSWPSMYPVTTRAVTLTTYPFPCNTWASVMKLCIFSIKPLPCMLKKTTEGEEIQNHISISITVPSCLSVRPSVSSELSVWGLALTCWLNHHWQWLLNLGSVALRVRTSQIKIWQKSNSWYWIF